MAASRKEAYVIGGFIIFFLFALLTEKIGDFKGSNSNMYVYLEENRKNNESKWWKRGERERGKKSKLDVLEPHHSLLEQFNLVH